MHVKEVYKENEHSYKLQEVQYETLRKTYEQETQKLFDNKEKINQIESQKDEVKNQITSLTI